MAARKNKKTKKVTVPQLKSWIEGAMEFNDDEWSPSAEQWKKIVEMIMNLEEEVVEVPVHQPAPQNQQPAVVPAQSTLVAADQQARPPKIDMRRIKEEHMAGAGQGEYDRTDIPAEFGDDVPVRSSGKIIKGRNIDTSDGNYESSFS